jgi:hypothetical protein
MRLARAARIGSWSTLEVRQMLRRLGPEMHDLPDATAVLGMPPAEARRVLTLLSRAGYLLREPSTGRAVRWRRTQAGETVAAAPLGSPFSRARADRLVARVLTRVATVNRQPHFLCRVTAVGVFGSYLTDTPSVAELDVVAPIAPKPPVPGTADTEFRPDRRLPYWRLQNLLPPAEWPRWRERHVELFLAAGLRGLVLHRFEDPMLCGHRVRLVFLEQPGVP